MRSKNKIILWPSYFDVAVSWENGRRVPKSLAKRSPSTEDIVKAAISAGLKAELQPGMAHPRHHWHDTGYVLVESKESKSKILKLIGQKLSR